MMPPKPAAIDLLAIVSISFAVTIDVTHFIMQKWHQVYLVVFFQLVRLERYTALNLECK